MSVPKVYLNMIVKNESRVILRLLQSVLPLIDGYCICDTGSTDNTVELITTFFKMANLPGIIVNEPFRDFGYNRSFALKECLTAPGITENDYILLMDADMILSGPWLEKAVEFKQALTHDVYLMMQGSENFHYKNARIVKNKGFSYWGVTHEYLQTKEGSTYQNIEKKDLFIKDIGDGGAKSDKWERDIRLLTKGLEDDPTASRYAFYLANTYRDSGNSLKAIEYYKKRIEMGGWMEEVWHSYYSAGKCYMFLKDVPNAINMWLEGYQFYPNRLEAIYQIIHYYRNTGKNRLAYQYYRMADSVRKRYGGASNDFLFLERDVYDYKIDYELSVFGYYENLDNYDLKRVSMNVLACPLIEEGISRNVLSNYKFYVQKAIDSAVSSSFSPSSLSSSSSPLLELLKTIGSTIPADELDGFQNTTPSICYDKEKNQLVVNTRYVNYHIDSQGNYVNKEKIITKNLISVIDILSNSLIKEQILEYDTSLDNQYIGLEDIRLHIGPTGLLYYNTNRGLGYSNIQVEHGEIFLDLDSDSIKTEKNRLLKKEGMNQVEKNWVLFNSGSNNLRCIYGWSPLIIGEIKDDQYNTLVEYKDVPAFFKFIRGSTNGVEIDGDIWFICHAVSYESRRYYYHIVVVLDKITGALKKYTNLFLLEKELVEYTLGFVELGSNLLIGYSVLDRETKYMEVPKKWFEEQMINV
jgi:tetratricopeptide (TPR) repeat protein